MIRTIFHIDVNSAFLSWTAVKMISQGQPDVRLVPAVVSGDPDDRRSIVTAKSIPAKKFGINTAEPLSMALRKCPGLIVVHSDFGWYKECSRGFIAICRKYSPVLQQFLINMIFSGGTLAHDIKDPAHVPIVSSHGRVVNQGCLSAARQMLFSSLSLPNSSTIPAPEQ